MLPERLARQNLDNPLQQCGWLVQNRDDMTIMAGMGVAVREFPLKTRVSDYLLYLGGKAAGVIEAKPEGTKRCRLEDSYDGVPIAKSTKLEKAIPKNIMAFGFSCRSEARDDRDFSD